MIICNIHNYIYTHLWDVSAAICSWDDHGPLMDQHGWPRFVALMLNPLISGLFLSPGDPWRPLGAPGACFTTGEMAVKQPWNGRLIEITDAKLRHGKWQHCHWAVIDSSQEPLSLHARFERFSWKGSFILLIFFTQNLVRCLLRNRLLSWPINIFTCMHCVSDGTPVACPTWGLSSRGKSLTGRHGVRLSPSPKVDAVAVGSRHCALRGGQPGAVSDLWPSDQSVAGTWTNGVPWSTHGALGRSRGEMAGEIVVQKMSWKRVLNCSLCDLFDLQAGC